MARRYNHPAGSELPLIAVEARPVFGTELCDKKIEVAVNGTLDTDPNFDYRIDHPEKGGLSNSVVNTMKERKAHTLTFSTSGTGTGSLTVKVDGIDVTSPATVVPGHTVAMIATTTGTITWQGLPDGTSTEGGKAIFEMPHENLTVTVTFTQG